MIGEQCLQISNAVNAMFEKTSNTSSYMASLASNGKKIGNNLEVKAVFDKGDYSAKQSTENNDLRGAETEETAALQQAINCFSLEYNKKKLSAPVQNPHDPSSNYQLAW